MQGGSCGVGTAETTKNSKSRVVGWDAIEELERGLENARTTWPPVDQERGCGDGLSPKLRWHGSMEEYGA